MTMLIEKATKMTRWTVESIADQSGKTAIVTGANSGLGYETALALVSKGAEVIIACRDQRRAELAMKAIRSQVPTASMAFIALDLADLNSVRKFSEEFINRYSKLDILCNNAGVMALPHRKTKDGFEMQIGTNHLGHFALTGRLLPVLKKTRNARVVNVSSGYHWFGSIRLDDINRERGYRRWPAYCQSKLAVLMFSFELQRRFRREGISAISAAAHPGYAKTNLQFAGPAMEKTWFAQKIGALTMELSNLIAAQPARMGALPLLYAATAPEMGEFPFFGPRFELRGYPVVSRPAPRACDETVAKKLWTLSEELVGLKFL